MNFKVGRGYTRQDIHDQLGGSLQAYLPTRNGEVVCGCFTKELNPGAPEEILVGDAPDVIKIAELLINGNTSIPIFLKSRSNFWEYRGTFHVVRCTRDPLELSRKGRDGTVMAIQFEPDGAEEAPSAYLLTWNPKRWPWSDLENSALVTAEGRTVPDNWSTGRSKRIKPGDRLFLLKQGCEPSGIMGSGYALSVPYLADHWDEERSKVGEKALLVEVRFDRILNPDFDELLPRSALRTGKLAEINWNTQSSGISLGESSEELEDLWRRHLQGLDYDHSQDEELSGIEGEQRQLLIRHRRREKWLRNRKIKQAMKANRGRLPCEVPGCHFDFVDVYGEELGKGFAHVHHHGPLGERQRPSETRLEDLAIVCPNCHAMIHRFGQNRLLGTLINNK